MATLTNAVRNVRISLMMLSSATQLFQNRRHCCAGTCAANTTLSGTSASGATVALAFSGNTPGVVTVTSAE